MQITRITKKNEEYFRSFLSDTTDYHQPNLLRLGAVSDDGEILGALSAFIDGDVAEIVSIYVEESARRQGCGRAMVEALVDVCEKTEGAYTAVNAFFTDDLILRAFLESVGFDIFNDMSTYQIRFGEIMRAERCRKILLRNDIKGIRSIASLDESGTRLLNNFLAERNMPTRGYYDPEWSTVCMNDGGITSAMLIRPSEDKVEVLWFDIDSRDIKEPIKHMAAYINKIESSPLYDGSTPVVFPDDNVKVMEAVRSLSGGAIHVVRVDNSMRAIRLLGNK